MPPLEICSPGLGPLWPVRKYGPAYSFPLRLEANFYTSINDVPSDVCVLENIQILN
jgi:hypothetical protein